jgi:hypothetical protein
MSILPIINIMLNRRTAHTQKKIIQNAPSPPQSKDYDVDVSGCKIDEKKMRNYFAPILDGKRIIQLSERKAFTEKAKKEYGITEFTFNVKGGITISWAHLTRIYCNRMGVCSCQ